MRLDYYPWTLVADPPTAAFTTRHCWTRLIDQMANRIQRVQAPVFVRITCSYRFSPKSLLVEPVNTHFVFITQITYRDDITK